MTGADTELYFKLIQTVLSNGRGMDAVPVKKPAKELRRVAASPKGEPRHGIAKTSSNGSVELSMKCPPVEQHRGGRALAPASQPRPMNHPNDPHSHG
jgi:hypothetical protein